MNRRRPSVTSALPMVWVLGCTERGEVLTPLVRDEPATTIEDPSTESEETAGDAAARPEPSEPSEPALPLPPVSDASVAPDAGAVPSPPEFTNDAYDVSASWNHTCAVSRGRAYCWGLNSSGQLGLGDAELRSSPTRVDGAAPFVAISAARRHTCALLESGEILCWGANDRGQLGQGDRQSRSSPVSVNLPAPAASLSSDFEHACALLDDARLYCWGKNDEGQLGQSDGYPSADDRAADALRPVEVPGADFTHVDTGDGHTCATRDDGSLWCFGRNSFGELGNDRAEQIRTPTRVGTRTNWASSDAGQNHSCALERDGALWCWGRNTSAPNDGAPLGLAGVDVIRTPTRVGTETGWSELGSDTFHTCALRANELYCWGRNAEGQLGTGDLDVRAEPTHVGPGYAKIAAGRFHTCALTTELGVRCSGANADGRLGTGDTERRRVFVDVTLPED